jgi:hypothetical protein
MRGSEGLEREEPEPCVGTAEAARRRVRAYFQSLRDQLCVQEVAALTVVDTHVRERLCSIRQQEEDIATLLSQVRALGLTIGSLKAVLRIRDPVPFTPQTQDPGWVISQATDRMNNLDHISERLETIFLG